MTQNELADPGEREPAMRSARHGVSVPRGQGSLAGARGGRFGRMFGFLAPCDPDDERIDALVAAMKTRPAQNQRIPAGYTYFGQFVDHDITFDPLSQLQRDNDPHALTNFRTPRFDLDSLYGSGPADQPFLYDWSCPSHGGVKLLAGSDARSKTPGTPRWKDMVCVAGARSTSTSRRAESALTTEDPTPCSPPVAT